ncbi:MAG: M24 family metallopeptidase [Alphaproteobacteria bacterium]|nr:M24 family metallopeptidase [Alphaproteobacteria bacterium]
MRKLMIAAIAALAPVVALAAELKEAAEPIDPPMTEILPLRARAEIEDAWLAERLDTVVPQIMREADADMWIMIAREYNEDPVVKTMLPATWLNARRRTILILFDRGPEAGVERLAVSRYPIAARGDAQVTELFPAAWDPEAEPDQWKRVAEIVAERDPKKIVVNVDSVEALGDGMTKSQYDGLIEALPRKYRGRIDETGFLATRWLETRIPAEMDRYPELVRIAHSIIGEAMSGKVITPGETTTQDVVWWMRQRVRDLGLATWFHTSVTIQRQEEGPLKKESEVQAEARANDQVIRQGDFLHVDFGITYLGLNTDTQHHAYVLKPGETDAPQGLKDGLAAANAVQEHLIDAFKTGRTSNEILAIARAASIADGLRPSIYSHQIGFHGHAAGSPIGWWDDQSDDHPQGTHPLYPHTAWSIELNATRAVPEWGGQDIVFKTEEDAYFDGETVEFLDGRQKALHLIPRPGRQ